MCLAIPMKVVELKEELFGDGDYKIAVVDADGIQKEVRLDVVDTMPQIGNYLIVHAGFAIHTLDEDEAQTNLKLLREMASGLGLT